jgi:hypothetical protein
VIASLIFLFPSTQCCLHHDQLSDFRRKEGSALSTPLTRQREQISTQPRSERDTFFLDSAKEPAYVAIRTSAASCDTKFAVVHSELECIHTKKPKTVMMP